MKRALDFVLVDVFTDSLFGGNQLAVFPRTSGLSDQSMSAISRELKVNETVFVTGNIDDGFAARIYSPHGELSFAGHPIIGTASILADQIPVHQGKRRFVLNVPAGPVPIEIIDQSNQPHIMCQSPTLPLRLRQSVQSAKLAAMLGLSENQLAIKPAMAAAYTSGIPFFCIPLIDRAAVTQAKLEKSAWSSLLQSSKAPHLYVFAFGQHGEIFARMFAPGVGIVEDPATGAAAVALGGYLATYYLGHDELANYTIYQGIEMGRPSQIRLEVLVARSELISVRIGGQCTLFGSGTLSAETAQSPQLKNPNHVKAKAANADQP